MDFEGPVFVASSNPSRATADGKWTVAVGIDDDEHDLPGLR